MPLYDSIIFGSDYDRLEEYARKLRRDFRYVKFTVLQTMEPEDKEHNYFLALENTNQILDEFDVSIIIEYLHLMVRFHKESTIGVD